MSRNNKLGQVRRSQVLGYGPGAIVDFRAGAQGGGPVSIIAGSLESWEETARTSGATDPHIVYEERLQKVLNKQYFRLAPIDDSNEGEPLNRWLRGYRFPYWLLCPNCHELRPASKWARELGDPSRWCSDCSNKMQRRIFVVPTRFVVACENGHIDEFPWQWWLRSRTSVKPSCGDQEGEAGCRLMLKSAGGSGLEGLVLSCTAKGCGAYASMAGAFSSEALKGLRCAGKKPWLTRDTDVCAAAPRTLQRGASNLYFPVTYSSLSIPPWSDRIQEDIRSVWEALKGLKEPLLSQMITGLAQTQASQHSMSEADFAAVVRQRLQLDGSTTLENLRVEEYVRLTSEGQGDNSTFQVKQEKVPLSLIGLVDKLARVERLREVRALTGFKRIYDAVSVTDPGRGAFGDLCRPDALRPWLPAAEVRGEGIFVSLKREAVEHWISVNPSVQQRADKVNAASAKQLAHRQDTVEQFVTAVSLLVHSVSHSVIKRLSFECGYDVASLRERLYINQDPWMAGFLIFTSTSDADGTLGGLERQGKSQRFEQIVATALHDAAWCSSDPLCREGVSSTSEGLNLAACHSCLLLPETCCENGNRYLDRLLLVNDGHQQETGFFNAFMQSSAQEH